MYLDDDSHWRLWNNMWTAEEDRHGAVLNNYARDTGILNQRVLEEMQFNYIRNGFHPGWDRDPYRVFVYTTVQERATQVSHAETGRLAGQYEPSIGEVLRNVATEEARHFQFYRSVFEEILKRDPDQALHSASFILPSIEMPGHSMPHFREIADVIRRSGIYGPRDYLRHRRRSRSTPGRSRALPASASWAARPRKRFSASRHGSRRSPSTSRPGAGPRPSASRWCSTVNSRWSSVVLGLLLVAGCSRGEGSPPLLPGPRTTPADEAALLGGEIFDVIDQVMSFRSAHGGHWPRTLREVGVDSLTRSTIRRLQLPGRTSPS